MKDEQIKQNAKYFAINETGGLAYKYFSCEKGFIAGAHSRDEEIEKLKSLIKMESEIREGLLRDKHKLQDELDKLRNPWISVEDRLPDEPLTICAVWLKGDDLVPHISLYDSGRFLLLPVDVTVTHWMPIPQIEKGE